MQIIFRRLAEEALVSIFTIFLYLSPNYILLEKRLLIPKGRLHLSKAVAHLVVILHALAM